MDNNLRYGVNFDLDEGAKRAYENAAKFLRQLELMFKARPLAIDLKVNSDAVSKGILDDEGKLKHKAGSIDALNARIKQLSDAWNAMAESERIANKATGELTAEASKNRDEWARLNAMLKTTHQTLAQLQQASDAKDKSDQKAKVEGFRAVARAAQDFAKTLSEVAAAERKYQQETAKEIDKAYKQRQKQINEKISQLHREAEAENQMRAAQTKSVSVGYADLQKRIEAVKVLRSQYEALLPSLNAMAQKRVSIKMEIDKRFEGEIQRIQSEINKLGRKMSSVGGAGGNIQPYLSAINQLRGEIDKINQHKIELFNNNAIQGQFSRLRSEVSKVYTDMQTAERRLASDNSLNVALDKQSQKIVELHQQIAKLDAEFARLNSSGKAYNTDGSFTTQANALLQQRIALTRQLETASISAADAQRQREEQLSAAERKRLNELREAQVAAERQAKAETDARQKRIAALNAENQANQKAYNDKKRQGLEIQRALKAEENSISAITAKLQIQQQRLQNAKFGSSQFNKIAEEVRRLSAELDKARAKISSLTKSGESSTKLERAAKGWNGVNGAMQKQETYLSRLIKRLAVYYSVSSVFNFISKIREVTAEFELQRISLGAIIQDQTRANALFAEIKSFALQSPVSVLDLTKYTKQLAAYKIGIDDLFDTTKRLTDVSVGLGVSMDRVVLAYGQIRAASYLRASEVRQLTEMGVPIIEELAKKLSAANGELVKASDVMDMISKRQIPFDMVKEVFEDMTNKGGIFYDMQIKQGNTLYGLWAKLGDAASMMYDEIGRTGWVNDLMKGLIKTITNLMRNWESVAGSIRNVAIAFGAFKLAAMSARASALLFTVAGKEQMIKATQRVTALRREAEAMEKSGLMARLYQKQQIGIAVAQLRATQATNLFTKSLYKLKAAFLSNPLGWAVLAITALIEIFSKAADAVDKLQAKFAEIETTYADKNTFDRSNFKKLADEAVNSVNGSKKQKDALDELNRTYGNIVDSQNLQIVKLRELNGEYASLTQMVEAYNEKQKHSEKEAAIKEAYGQRLKTQSEELLNQINDFEERGELTVRGVEAIREYITDLINAGKWNIDWSKIKDFKLDEEGNISNIVLSDGDVKEAERYKEVLNGILTLMTQYGYQSKEYFWFAGGSGTKGALTRFMEIIDAAGEYNATIKAQNESLADNDTKYKNAVNSLNAYAAAIDRIQEAIANGDWSYPEMINANAKAGMLGTGDPTFDVSNVIYDPSKVEGEYAKYVEQINAQLQVMYNNLAAMAAREGINLPKEYFTAAASWAESHKTEFSMINWDEVERIFAEGSPKLIAAGNSMKELQETIASTDPAVRQIQQHLIVTAENTGIVGKAFGRLKQYLWDGNNNLKEHVKALDEAIAGYEADIKRWSRAVQVGGWLAQQMYAQKIADTEALVKALKEQAKFERTYLPADDKKKKGSKSDTTLQELREIYDKRIEIYKKYESLVKKEGKTAATKHIEQMYGGTLKRLNDMGKRFGLSFKMSDILDIKELEKGSQKIIKIIDTLKQKGAKKAALELQLKLDNLNLELLAKQVKEQLKRIADRISRSKEMQEFYDKIFDLTGSSARAEDIAKSIFGGTGSDLQALMADEIRQIVGSVEAVKLPKGIINADNIVNFKSLREFADKNKAELGEMYDKLIKIADDGQKRLANTYQGYLKDLKVAETYADKRVKLARETAAKIAEIEKLAAAGDIPKKEAEMLTSGYKRREQTEQAKLEWEAFKDMPYYVAMFEDLDHASTEMLKRMRSGLMQLKSQWGKSLNPTELKELQKRLNEISKQLAKSNPFKALGDAIKQYRNMKKYGDTLGSKSRDEAEEKLKNAETLLGAAKVSLDFAMEKGTTAQQETAQRAYDAAKKSRDEAQEAVLSWKRLSDWLSLASEAAGEFIKDMGMVAHGIADITGALGGSEEDVQFWNDIADGLDQVGGAVDDIIKSVASGNVLGIVKSAVSAIPKLIVGFSSIFNAGRIRRANKEIKRQKNLLEQLQYTYDRLNNAADKLFGRDYISNYNTQMANLKAQQNAYLKQAEAENSKGKKKDKDAYEGYLKSAQETADKIRELQDDMVSRMMGSDRASAAKEFAQSWLEAKASFANTSDAIKSKYKDMIKSMIIEGAAAKLIDSILAPMWKQVQSLLENNPNDTMKAVDYLANNLDAFTNQANSAMETLWRALEARGYDLKELIGDTDSKSTGIAKSVASATSEEINALTAAINTAFYYFSPIPLIAENVAAIRAQIVGATSATQTITGGGTVDADTLVQQHLACLPNIEANTAMTVQKMQEAINALNRVISPKGTTSTHGVNVYLRN